jgi:hypothetical protein
MAVSFVLARLRQEPLSHLPIADLVRQACEACELEYRNRLLTPLVTLRLFLLQILHGNTAINHLRQLSGLAFVASSYCEARERLPLAMITGLIASLARWAGRADGDKSLPGQRVLVVDGSTFSTPDEPGLRERFGLYPTATVGVAYPMGKLLGLLDLATGMFVELLALPLLIHDMGGVARLHPSLRAGDILVGDRAFCSFAHFHLLSVAGVFGCFRLHQRRKPGKGRERWGKPSRCPAWMSPEQFATLPAFIDVRLVGYAVVHKGFRTKHVTVATTLLDETMWSDEQLANLYGHRWEAAVRHRRIETCFGYLKTTMGMNMLRCRTVAGVEKELAMYLLAYNLVRLAMVRMAGQRRVEVRKVSFIDAMRYLAARMMGLAGVEDLIINPTRPGRTQPRVIRGRLKQYDLMNRPRSTYKTTPEPRRKA